MKRSGMKKTGMERSIKRLLMGCLSAIALTAAVVAAPSGANALDRRDVIGGMSAAEVMGAPYYPAYGYGVYSGAAAPVAYGAPLGPPPGCAIRHQRVWDGYRWTSRKLRICH
jgi:hypothetical protein